MFVTMNRFRVRTGYTNAFETVWRSRADFEAWTRSDACRRAHKDAGQNKGLYLGHPEFEGFEAVLRNKVSVI